MSDYAQQLKALHEAMVHKQSHAMLPLIKPARHTDISVAERLAVYADGYDTRLIDATLADYPALAHYMGASTCRAAIAAYVAATSSRHWDLNRYPVAFADFFTQHAVDKAAHALATLEAAIAHVFWAAESEPLMPDTLSRLSEEALAAQYFTLRAASCLLVLDYDANDYLGAFRAGAAPDTLNKKLQHVLVVRHHNEVKREVLDLVEYELLAALQAGLTFGDAVATVSNQALLAERLPDYIARWFAGGFMQNSIA